jgi:hypothetical protein
MEKTADTRESRLLNKTNSRSRIMADMMNITVTTLDLNKAYEVVGPVCGSSLGQTDPDQGFLAAVR